VRLIVDLFAGGGGASRGIELASGRSPDVAINHDSAAIAMHVANHPRTRHYCESIQDVDPLAATGGVEVDFLWASPDCKHFSRAKGKAIVRSKEVRSLADVVVTWARAVRPRVIMVENVEEFQTWGPLDANGQPDPALKGTDFVRWVGALRACGYAVEWRTLRACDYGAPTTRKRLFVIARCDGQPIVWPAPTHDPSTYRTAAECIDWTLPCQSIFDRKRPLADKTLARIARGIERFVTGAVDPYLRDDIAHTLVQTGYGERPGQTPRALDLGAPMGTVVAGGSKQALVACFLAKHYGGHGTPGSDLRAPFGTITCRDHHALVATLLHRFDVDPGRYRIVDIGMRMLTPRELARGQGFDDAYLLVGSQTQQIRMIGNSVSPLVARALVAANVTTEPLQLQERAA
jgi:DNA (cytosine-5)-methyltransferase 1